MHPLLHTRDRRSALGLLLLFLFGCAGYARRMAYPEMTREEMFRALSTHTWFGEMIDNGGRRETFEAIPYGELRLFADGRYDHRMHYDEGHTPPLSGQWNFAKTGPRTGALRFTNGEDIHIVLFAFPTNDRLVVRDRPLQLAYVRREPRLESTHGPASDLPDVPLPAALVALVGTRWVSAADNPAPHVPLSVTFLPDGRVQQELTREECPPDVNAEDMMFRRHRPDGTCVMDRPFTAGIRRQERFVFLYSIWPYLPAGSLGPERFGILKFKQPLEGWISYVPTGGVPSELRISLVGAAPGATLTIGEMIYENAKTVMTRQLAKVVVAEPIQRDMTTSIHVTFERPPSSPATPLMFAYRAPSAKEPVIAIHYFP
ncbi:MAG TPA: hypothetical protein VE010_07405 [Thermoanaerobaculia bacterium]|nr:hypothetical protein [Thermoanaerobaculia bacterium]